MLKSHDSPSCKKIATCSYAISLRAARGGQLLQWFSTHPSSATRIDTIKNNLKDVMPLYEQATAALGCLITHTYPQK